MNAKPSIITIGVLTCVLLASTQSVVGLEVPRNASTSQRDHTAAATAKAMQVRAGYAVHLAAAEPDVIDPVSATWSSDGKLWVVEMPDYPTVRPEQTQFQGRIRVLSDRDADGRFQTATTFADGLNFATGVLPWRDGAIVTTAGEIVFLRDSDGDGQADAREIWFQGFTIDNEQLRANHPTLGPDGLVYVAGGLRGGEIHAVAKRFDAEPQSVNLQNHDFFFDPLGGDWGVVSGKSQHGLTIDDFNRRIGCSNRNPAILATIPVDLIARDPYLNASDGIVDVGLAGFESHVSPISNAWTTSNLHAGQFSAACGVCAPGWRSAADAEWLLVCEPTGSLVQRQSLRLVDGNWWSVREKLPTEWLACADDWFRPVDIVPDFAGAVLVVDMSRAVIEHPHWAPPELQHRPDTWDGNDQGRLWLVSSGGKVPQVRSITDDDAAINAIVSEDPLLRSLASSYCYAKYAMDSSPPDSVIESFTAAMNQAAAYPGGVARIALLLNRWDALTSGQLDKLTKSEDTRLRALAVSMRDCNRPDGAMRRNERQLTESLTDPALLVRQAAMESLVVSIDCGESDDRLSEALLKVAHRDGDQSRMQKLLVSLPGECAIELLGTSLRSSPRVSTELMEGWMLRAAKRLPKRSATMLGDWIGTRENISGNFTDAAVAMQLSAAWKAGAANQDGASDGAELLGPLIDPLAKSIAIDGEYPDVVRVDAVQWCRTLSPLPTGIRKLVQPNSPVALRAIAFRILMQRDAQWCQQYILEHVDEISPADRAAIVSAAQQQTASAIWLLTKIDEEKLPRTFVDPVAMDWFRNHRNAQISDVGKRIFAPPGDVAAAIQEYSPALQQIEDADVVVGKSLFAQNCASCHQIDGVGYVLGPDISDSRTKTPAALLTGILDPNAGIDASYVTYNVVTVDGEAITGLLAGESSDAVTLQLAGGQTRRIDREDIELFRPSDVSLMPSGLQRVLDVNQMRDLIGYLKRWRYATSD